MQTTVATKSKEAAGALVARALAYVATVDVANVSGTMECYVVKFDACGVANDDEFAKIVGDALVIEGRRIVAKAAEPVAQAEAPVAQAPATAGDGKLHLRMAHYPKYAGPARGATGCPFTTVTNVPYGQPAELEFCRFTAGYKTYSERPFKLVKSGRKFKTLAAAVAAYKVENHIG